MSCFKFKNSFSCKLTGLNSFLPWNYMVIDKPSFNIKGDEEKLGPNCIPNPLRASTMHPSHICASDINSSTPCLENWLQIHYGVVAPNVLPMVTPNGEISESSVTPIFRFSLRKAMLKMLLLSSSTFYSSCKA